MGTIICASDAVAKKIKDERMIWVLVFIQVKIVWQYTAKTFFVEEDFGEFRAGSPIAHVGRLTNVSL
jgi:hypothetical protein